jgi:hypothetical protein
MFQREEIAALEEELEGYRAKLSETEEERMIEFVFKSHSFLVKKNNELVRLGTMSAARAEDRRYSSVDLALSRAKRRWQSNEIVRDEISKLLATLRATM